jgi:hypothetical protein
MSFEGSAAYPLQLTKKETNMNELLFTPGVEAPAHLARVIANKIDSSALARHLLALAAAVVVNLAVLGTLQLTAAHARYAPPGEVVITQLETSTEARVARIDQ